MKKQNEKNENAIFYYSSVLAKIPPLNQRITKEIGEKIYPKFNKKNKVKMVNYLMDKYGLSEEKFYESLLKDSIRLETKKVVKNMNIVESLKGYGVTFDEILIVLGVNKEELKKSMINLGYMKLDIQKTQVYKEYAKFEEYFSIKNTLEYSLEDFKDLERCFLKEIENEKKLINIRIELIFSDSIYFSKFNHQDFYLKNTKISRRIAKLLVEKGMATRKDITNLLGMDLKLVNMLFLENE